MSRGIDVSNNNGHVDWASIAGDGYTYAVAKATEGLAFQDAFYHENRQGAEAHGLKFGGYHFFTPGEDAAEQVKFFLDHAQPRTGEIVPALDYEKLPADREPAEQFVDALHRQLGHWPFFYSYLAFVQAMKIPAASPLARCPLWLADFTSIRPAPPAPWHEIVIWQHSSTGRVPGIGGAVDLDLGAPILTPAPKPKEWDITYRDKTGKRRTHRSQAPGSWLASHPNPKYNGRITVSPVKQ
jgi:lysozyme